MWYHLFFEIPPEFWKKGQKSIQSVGSLYYAQNRSQIGSSTWEQGIKALKLSCNVLKPFKPTLQQTESWKIIWEVEVVKIKDAFCTFGLTKWDFTLGTLQGF